MILRGKYSFLLFWLLSLSLVQTAASRCIIAESRTASISERFVRHGFTTMHSRAVRRVGSVAPARYRIDATQSHFFARAFSGGVLWFKGHDHIIAISGLTGEAQLDPDTINEASLQMRVRADSLEETRDEFTEPQKQIINKEIREIVLETSKYPEIVFNSTAVTARRNGEQIDAQIEGDLTMHGVTRHITVPAQVTLNGNDLRARGTFSVKRSDYNIKATSALHGTIRVRDSVKLTFDILAHRV